MKSILDYIEESNTPYTNYNDKDRTVVCHLERAPREVADKWDEIGPSPSTAEEEFDYVNVELKYGSNELCVTCPDMFDSYSVKIVWYGFKVKKPLEQYHDTGLKKSDLTPVKGRGCVNTKYPEQADKAADFLVWFFNNQPEPLFK